MRPRFPHDYQPGIAGHAPLGFAPTGSASGRWFVDALKGSQNSVGAIAPAGYAAYVRLPHPYWLEVPPATDGSLYDPSDSAGESGYWRRPVRRSEAARLRDASGTEPPLDPPIDSAMGAPSVIRPLVDVLRAHTPAHMACLCGFWETRLPTIGGTVAGRIHRTARPGGFRHVGSLIAAWRSRRRDARVRREIIAAATAHGPPGQVLLYRGTLDEIAWWLSDFGTIKIHFHPPSACWPEDRRWCVAMPQNKPVSIVAGTRGLIDDILAVPGIDACETTTSADVWNL